MAECNYINECAFYNNRLQEMPMMKDFIKDMVCRKRPSTCLRLKEAEISPIGNADNMTTPLLPDARRPHITA